MTTDLHRKKETMITIGTEAITVQMIGEAIIMKTEMFTQAIVKEDMVIAVIK